MSVSGSGASEAPGRSGDGSGQLAADTKVVLLHGVRSRTELKLLAGWAAKEKAGAPLVAWADVNLAELSDDALLVPSRIAWIAPTDGKPRRPWRIVQPAVALRMPGSVMVVEGEPATVGELRQRHDAEPGEWESLEDLVAHAATLACDRAERRLVGDRYKVPRRVAEQVAASGVFRREVKTLADRLQRPYQSVLTEAGDALAELATALSPAAIDAYRAVLAPMHTRAWKVHVDTETLEPLRELNRKHALVFLPAHRSYVDPLVLGEVLHEHDFPRNHLLGGNNMAIWPIGPLGKRAGVVFIRRSNSDDYVYKLALREYLAYMASKRFNLEWYIEGGRTRTGKLRPPKLGLLSYLTRAVENGRVDDVLLVPTSIVYDHLHEVSALSDEQGGAAKAAEGSLWLARYVTGQLRNSGNAWVRFGEPFSLRDELAAAGEGGAQLEKVAFRICDGINRTTPMTPTALVTFALLSVNDRAMTLAEVRQVVEPLLDYLSARGLHGPQEVLRDSAEVNATLAKLVEVGVATAFSGGPEPVWSVSAGRHRVAAFYRNGALHHLITRAIVELGLLRVAGESAKPDQSRVEAAWREALRLRDLLKFEFFFPPTEQFRADVIAELELIDPQWDEKTRDETGAARMLAAAPFLVAHGVVRTFFDAQLVVAQRLVEFGDAPVSDDKDFITSCLGLGEQWSRRGFLHRADSVSKELYSTALDLARHRELVNEPDRLKERQKYLAEVRDVLTRVSRIAEMQAADALAVLP